VRASWGKEFIGYTECNVDATQRLLETVRHLSDIKRVVYASSSSVYGNTTDLPLHEDAQLHPYSPYGVTKLAAEHLCTLYHRNFGVPTVSLRYFTVYGPRQRPDMAFHHFCKSIILNKPIHIYDDGNQTRDFTYISDVVQANIQAAQAEAAIGHVINIAGGSRVTLCNVVEILETISGTNLQIVHEARQYGDVRHTFADTHRARQLLDYRPHVQLIEGLAHEFEDLHYLYQSSAMGHFKAVC
jgi:UDP-glucose 4-epimerase